MSDAGVVPVAEAVAAVWAGWAEDFRLEAHVLGTVDPVEIAVLVDGFVAAELGSSVVGAAGYHVSVACVFDLVLADGRRAVVKAHQPRWSPPFLAATQRVQAHLCGQGFPVPSPWVGPRLLGRGWATVEHHLPDPGFAPTGGLGPAERRVSAAGLATLTHLCRDLGALDGLEDDPMAVPAGARYPVPHSPLFEFGAGGPEAARIDALADRALAQRAFARVPAVVTHGDWSRRNVRLGPGSVSAVYDCDSLGRLPECWAAGQAAATWSMSGDADDTVPAAADVAAFVRDYEQARGSAFSAAEWSAAGAAALYTLAYTARCEQALVGPGWRPADRPGAAWARLAGGDQGAALLALRR